LLAGGCSKPPVVVHRFGGPTMGSTYEVKFVGAVPMDSVRAVVEAELRRHDEAFSKWRPDSEILRCNQHRSTEPFPVSPLFASVLALALRLAEATGGAFDPTVEPLLACYRAAKAKPHEPLDEAAFAAARELVGYRMVSVQDGVLRKQRPEVQLDLDGIVAGACADAIAVRLDALGVPAFYLEITGEVYCRGEKAPGLPWIIGVVDPAADVPGAALTLSEVPLRDRSLCTSGDYRNALVVDGRRLHHIFDPRTGQPAEHGVVSVSVLAEQAAVADALGTALLVLGDQHGAALLGGMTGFGPLQALFLSADADGGLRRSDYRWPAAPR
jgi:thiamine biosynthesis lipoprotein